VFVNETERMLEIMKHWFESPSTSHLFHPSERKAVQVGFDESKVGFSQGGGGERRALNA